MKKIFENKKRFMAGAIAAAVITAGTVFAAEGSEIMINGVKLDGPDMFVSENDITYVPVRAICETLGMQVSWDNDNEIVTIAKMPVYITFSPNYDGYTFAKTAPMQLGSAPILEDGVTYVPVNFIDEILHAEYDVEDNGNINIKYDIDNSIIADVIEKNKDEKYTSLRINDRSRGEEVIVYVTGDTVIRDEAGNDVGFDEIEKDDILKMVYSDAMTMSIPPITNAVSIVVLDAEKENKAVTVVESSREDNRLAVTVDDPKMGMQIVLNVTDETIIEDENGNKVDFDAIKKGGKLEVEHSEAMTRSLPPITNAIKIVVLENAE